MKEFSYVIKDEVGIHARPAGEVVKLAKKYDAVIKISVNDRTAEATKLLAIMSLGAKKGMTLKVTVEGKEENEAADAMESFMKETL